MRAPPDDFVQLYRAQFTRVAVQLYAYLGDHAEAQDLAQEAFCRALERWPAVSGYADPAAWVRHVAWNLATSRLRRLQSAMRFLQRQRTPDPVQGPSPDRLVLLEALAKLPPAQRKALVLRHLGQLTAVEIAEQEGVAEGTVRSWLSRGRTALAAELREEAWHA
jgi:RNA polymerase sigma-70 factor (ECF subfamily)